MDEAVQSMKEAADRNTGDNNRPEASEIDYVGFIKIFVGNTFSTGIFFFP